MHQSSDKCSLLQEGSTAAILQRKPRGSREALQIQMHLGRRVNLEGEELRQWKEMQEAKEGERNKSVVQESIVDVAMEITPAVALASLGSR
jgi:hypothetical protein